MDCSGLQDNLCGGGQVRMRNTNCINEWITRRVMNQMLYFMIFICLDGLTWWLLLYIGLTCCMSVNLVKKSSKQSLPCDGVWMVHLPREVLFNQLYFQPPPPTHPLLFNCPPISYSAGTSSGSYATQNKYYIIVNILLSIWWSTLYSDEPWFSIITGPGRRDPSSGFLLKVYFLWV